MASLAKKVPDPYPNQTNRLTALGQSHLISDFVLNWQDTWKERFLINIPEHTYKLFINYILWCILGWLNMTIG